MKKILTNNKGNALISAIIAFSLLLVISVSTVSLTAASANLSANIREYNNTYYYAEAAVQKGQQQLKKEIAAYYKVLRDEATLNGYSTVYQQKFNSFFDSIVSNAGSSFKEPVFSGSYGNPQTSTHFSVENLDAAAGTADMAVESTATLSDGTKRTVRGTMQVKRIPLISSSGGSGSFDPSKNVLTVGGNMVFNASTSPTQIINVHGGSAEVGGYQNKNTVNKSIAVDSGYSVKVTPGLGDGISSSLTYETLLQRKSSQVTRYITASTPPTYSDRGSASDPHYLEGVEGLSFTLSSDSYYGQVYCRGNLTITNGNYYGNVFCDGNVTLNSAQVVGNIIAGGDINISGGTYGGKIVNSKLVDGAFFAGGNININNGGTVEYALIYAKNNFNMNSNPSGCAIIFAGGNIVVTVSNTFSYSGTMMAKGNFTLQSSASCWHSLNNNATFAQAAKAGNWFNILFPTTFDVAKIDVNDIAKQEKIYEK